MFLRKPVVNGAISILELYKNFVAGILIQLFECYDFRTESKAAITSINKADYRIKIRNYRRRYKNEYFVNLAFKN
jgi:hypothetical protein